MFFFRNAWLLGELGTRSVLLTLPAVLASRPARRLTGLERT